MTIETSTSIENLATALGKFQAETHGVVRDATNPFLKNRYATLEAVIETARPALTKAGLAFLQAPGGQVMGNAVELETMLMHGASGEWIRFNTIVPLTKTDPQGVGSAITYACRYALMAMLGLPPLDDDAEATKPQQKAFETYDPHGIHSKPKPQQMPPDLGYDPRKSVNLSPAPTIGPVAKPSKEVYIANALERIAGILEPSYLLKWATAERKMVWPQYGIDPHDEDGQKLVEAYKARMLVLEQVAEDAE